MTSIAGRILVTGSAGFMGSWVAHRLAEIGYEVYGIDNMQHGDKENIDHNKQKFTVLDLRNRSYVEDYIQYVKPEYLFHLAATAREGASQFSPILMTENNLNAYMNVLTACIKTKKLKKVILFSSMSVYGNQKPPFDETFERKPEDVYAVAKAAMERNTEILSEVYGFRYTIIRPHNCIMEDERLFFYDEDGNLYYESVKVLYEKFLKNKHSYFINSFESQESKLSKILGVYRRKRKVNEKALKFKTFGGRVIKVTPEHNIICWRRTKKGTSVDESSGNWLTLKASEVKVGDYLPIPKEIKVIEKDKKEVDMLKWLYKTLEDKELRKIRVKWDGIDKIFSTWQDKLKKYDEWLFYKSRRQNSLTLDVCKNLGIDVPIESVLFPSRSSYSVKRIVRITDDFLWLLGMFLAEGHIINHQGDYKVGFTTEDVFVKKVKQILVEHPDIQVNPIKKFTHLPIVDTWSKMLLYLLKALDFSFVNSIEKEIPSWILQLPLNRLKFFLQGFFEGDGVHKEDRLRHYELRLCTSSLKMAEGLMFILNRFNLIPVLTHKQAKFKKKYGDRIFNAYEINAWHVDNMDIMSWDKKLPSQRTAICSFGQVALVCIKDIEETKPTDTVYDISVEQPHNFLTASMVYVHNCFGENQSLSDLYRNVVAIFMNRIMRNEPIYIYGDGEQTRAFSYIKDSLDCYCKCMDEVTDGHIINIGGMRHITINKLAEIVIEAMGEKSWKIIHLKDRPREVKHAYCTYEKSVSLLGYKEEIGIEEGIHRMAHWAKQKGPQPWTFERLEIYNEKTPITWFPDFDNKSGCRGHFI